MEFKKSYERERIYQNPGSPIEYDYGFKVDKKGEKFLVPIGEYNIQDKIDSYLDSCDLRKIIERFKVTGDESILNIRKGFYGDITDMPSNYMDVLNLKIQAEEMFNALSAEDKLKFNNDVDQFLVAIGSDEFKSVVKEEVVENKVVESEVMNNAE